MNPWTEILNGVWAALREGPMSAALVEAIPEANCYRYMDERSEPVPPVGGSPVLVIDQTGGSIDLNYSPRYVQAVEELQVTVWTPSLRLDVVNALRLKVLAALDAAMPDFGVEAILDVTMKTGRMTLTADRIERDADGRLMQWRNDLRKTRQRAVLAELLISFVIDRETMADV